MAKKYVSLNRLSDFLDNLKSLFATKTEVNDKADSVHTHTIDNITSLQTTLDNKVPTTRSINGKTLDADIMLSASDIGADADGSASAALETAKEYASGLAESKSDIGHNHDDMYYTESEVDAKISETNTSITNIVNGATTVAKASHASEADSATAAESAEKAVKDGSDNIITSTYETKSDAEEKLKQAKSYTDSVKNDLLNGAGTAYDTLKELGDLIDDNTDAIDALNEVAVGKANKEHAHSILDVTNLQTSLDELASGKANKNHTHSISDVTDLQTSLDNKSDITHNHDTSYDAIGSANKALEDANAYTDNAVAQKSQVQIITWGADD